MTDIVFQMKSRALVTAESASAFLRALRMSGFIPEADGIGWISYDHYIPELDTRAGQSFKPNTVSDAAKVIAENGVEYLNIGILYENHYSSNDALSSTKLTAMVKALNLVFGMLADEFGLDETIDVYHSASLKSGRYWSAHLWIEETDTIGGYEEECNLNIGGDGSPDWNNLDAFGKRFSELANIHCPEFSELRGLLETHFGDLVVRVAGSEI